MKNAFLNLVLTILAGAIALTMALLPIAVTAVGLLTLGAVLILTPRGRQGLSITLLGLSTLKNRIYSSFIIVLGIACVVAVLTALLAMSQGMRTALQQSGHTDTAIILRGGATSESASVLRSTDLDALDQVPGIKADKQGRPDASTEILVPVSVRNRGQDINIPLRGVSEKAWDLRPRTRIVEGRTFRSGLFELIVGKDASTRFEELKVGNSVMLGAQSWKIVGAFVSDGAYNSELWGDRQSISAAYRRGNSATSMLVRFSTPGDLVRLQAALKENPAVNLTATRTDEFFARQSETLSGIVRTAGLIVGAIMAFGAIFGALNAMYVSVSTRSREIATLRAIGFHGTPVMTSVLLEAMMLALVGGLIGTVIVMVLFGHYTASTLSGFNQLVFKFDITPDMTSTGLKWALAIGFIGGFLPAVKAARLPVVAALREV